MVREWVDEGLLHIQEREQQQRLAAERRHHHTAVIKEQGPDLMRDLVNEVRTIIDEYRRKAGLGADEIAFEALPREGFCVARTHLPRVALECRPDYEAHALYCNMTRTEDHDSETVESVFNLTFTVDDSDHVMLRHGTEPLQALDEAVEFLLKPVLFPLIDHHL